nr:hypothetical protein [Tanacetum cinerariifolium]
KESPENSSEETVVSKINQEPPYDSDIHQLIEECSIKVPEEQKQKMEDTMFELVKICQEKEFLCIHDDINDLIESALDSKLLLINSNSQRLDKKEQEVKNVVEQPAEHGNRSIQSLQNFRVVHKKSDEVTESNTENLLPIPSKYEFTLEDEFECDMPAKDDCSLIFTTFSNPLFKDDDNFDSSDDKSLPDEDVPAEEFKIYSNPLCDEDEINSENLDPHYIRFLEELLIDDSILSDELSDANFEENPLISRPPPEPPDAETDAGEEIAVVMINKDKFDDDYQIFMFDKVFSLLSAENEDTIFDLGISE